MGEPEEGTAARIRRQITERELAALIHAGRGDGVAAEATAMEAVLLRRMLGPQGELPNPILPVHELYAQVLMHLDRPARAAGQLDLGLSINPNRALAILNRARAAARMSDRATAERFYERLLELWDRADPGIAPLKEAREYLRAESRSGRLGPAWPGTAP